MRRKSLFLSLALAVMMASTVLTALVLLTRHIPAFYIRSAVPPGEQRKELSADFCTKLKTLLDSIMDASPTPTPSVWRGQFREEEINSFFEENFLTWGLADILPDRISEPRISFEQDRIRLGFRYGSPPWSTMVSMDFRVWLAQNEPNVVVLELMGVHAGSLPISAQSLLEGLSEALRRKSIQVSWYRYHGNPTAALKFQNDQARATCQLIQLDLKPGMLTIVGQSNEAP
jgi:hypothetical protein